MEICVVFYFILTLRPSYSAPIGDNVKPRTVVFMHGVTSNAANGFELLDWIKQDFPGIKTFSLNSFQDAKSLVSLETQATTLGEELLDIIDSLDEKEITLIGHSQGALMTRFLTERLNDKGIIHTLISLAGPQAGQFGAGTFSDAILEVLTVLTGEVKAKLLLIAMKGATGFLDRICANKLTVSVNMEGLPSMEFTVGEMVSVCDYWKNPSTWEELKHLREFFNRMNNDVEIKNETLRSNFINLKKLVLVGSSVDGMITPWQSSFFGYFGPDGNKIIPMEMSELYTNDSFGLRTLKERDAIVECEVDDVNHTMIVHDRDLYDKCVRPHLGSLRLANQDKNEVEISAGDVDLASFPALYGDQRSQSSVMAVSTIIQLTALALVLFMLSRKMSKTRIKSVKQFWES